MYTEVPGKHLQWYIIIIQLLLVTEQTVLLFSGVLHLISSMDPKEEWEVIEHQKIFKDGKVVLFE